MKAYVICYGTCANYHIRGPIYLNKSAVIHALYEIKDELNDRPDDKMHRPINEVGKYFEVDELELCVYYASNERVGLVHHVGTFVKKLKVDSSEYIKVVTDL